MKRIVISITSVLLIHNLYSQTKDTSGFEETPKSIEEVMKPLSADSVVLYYNDRWQLVKPTCASIFRISKIDPSQGIFTGAFVDYYSPDSTRAVDGNYNKGKKEGRFSLYFANGQLAQTGIYRDDRKNGVWEYYYENGNRRQTLDFQGTEIFVREFWDEDGKRLVESGNGEWFGFDSNEKFVKTSGEVLNGRKNGTWKNVIESRKMTTNIEKYKDGKFLNGKMFSLVGGAEVYKDTLYCTLERPLTFLTAEKFQTNRCFKAQRNNWEFAKYPGGMETFYREIREKLVLRGSIIPKGVIRVQTTIDREGKKTNFKPVSSVGYEDDLIRVLQAMRNWTPTKINGKPTIQPKIISFEIR